MGSTFKGLESHLRDSIVRLSHLYVLLMSLLFSSCCLVLYFSNIKLMVYVPIRQVFCFLAIPVYCHPSSFSTILQITYEIRTFFHKCLRTYLGTMVWTNAPKSSAAEGLVPNPWHYWKVMEPVGVLPNRRKSGHWVHAKGILGPFLLSFFLLYGFYEVSRFFHSVPPTPMSPAPKYTTFS